MSDASQGAHRTHGRVGAVIGGRWRVDARIGAGGMATVYAVSDRQGNRAALKMLHAQLSRDAQTRARFVREGKVANSVAHPGVVRVLDDGMTDDGSAYLVLELLEGETIEARRLRLGGRLPLEEVLDTADMALDALAAAHAQQIIHRDVKPENFFLCHDGNVKLLDFGLARMKDGQAEATRTGVTIGTPEFMPPEQALGRRDSVDARSDVWGLGATMFNAITGEYVHDAATLHEQLMASATKRARPIRSLDPNVPAAVAAVIDRALELEMSDRWQSAQDMQDALRSARRGDDSSRTLLKAGETRPITSPLSVAPVSPTTIAKLAPDEEPTSSDRTQQMEPGEMGVLAARRTLAVKKPLDAIESGPIFGETTLAMDPGPRDPMSKLPVSPIPSTERMGQDRMSPGALPNAPPIAFGTVPAFTPSSVRGVHMAPVQPSFAPAPPPVPPGNAAPTLRSSARGALVFIAVFVISLAALLALAWRFLFT